MYIRIILCHHGCEYSDVPSVALKTIQTYRIYQAFHMKECVAPWQTLFLASHTCVSFFVNSRCQQGMLQYQVATSNTYEQRHNIQGGRHSQTIGAKLTPEKKRVFPACRYVKIQTFSQKTLQTESKVTHTFGGCRDVGNVFDSVDFIA